MALRIPERQREGVTILEPKGKITIGFGDIALRDVITSVLERGVRRVLLNLEGVVKVDASGLGELVSVHTRVLSRGGRLKLLNLPPKMNDIMQVTQLITVFEVFDDEDRAVASF